MSKNEAPEQSFNEDELADIMSEIEGLESPQSEESPEEESDEPQNIVDKIDGEIDDQSIQSVVENEKSDPVLQVKNEIKENVVSSDTKKTAPESKMEVPMNLEDSFDNLQKNLQEKTPAGNSFGKSVNEVSELQKRIDSKLTLIDNEEKNFKSHEEVLPFKAPQKSFDSSHVQSGTHTKMEFTASGQMNLALCFYIGKETVQVKLQGEDSLTIELANGATFKIPLKSAA